MTTRAFVIGRRRKGRRIRHAVAEVEDLLRADGWKVDSRIVIQKKDLSRHAARAVKARYDVVVAVGGDGAVLQVATALAETEVALGIIPTGTGNLLAGNLRIPGDRKTAVRVLLTGRRRRIDLGRVTVDGVDHDFAVACGVGFDAKVMDATGTGQKLRWGKLAYLANAFGQTKSIHNARHAITLDGVRSETEAAQVFVANFGRMLPVVAPRRQIRGDDGLLDVIVVRASGPIPGLLAGWEALMQKDLGESSGGHVFRAQAREIRIETDPPRLVETDGSVVGRTPLVASIRPAALIVLVPR
ncbi:MAG: diacylglycerol/lipid kinase family protein [Candidatus Limnocylindrales bacterium]